MSVNTHLYGCLPFADVHLYGHVGAHFSHCNANIADARKNLPFHVVANLKVNGIIGYEMELAYTKLVLVSAQASTSANAILVGQHAGQRVYAVLVRRQYFMLHEQRERSKGIGAVDTQSQFGIVASSLLHPADRE